ncbi:MAG: hypothetical protein Q7J05_04120 [Paludibacter sp.]|nr:hypothetical protein [Paludibacter sp.]
MDTAFSWLLENYPIIGVVLLIILATAYIAFKFAKLHTRFISHEQKVSSLPCDHPKENIGTLQRENTMLKDIRESVRKIEEYIIRKDSGAIDSLLRKCSPYKITFLGDALLNESGGRSCVDENLEVFIAEIEKLNPLVALDVENYSLSVLNENLKGPLFNNIKNYIYNAPDPVTMTNEDGSTTDLSIKLEDILMVMSIYLRDKYFEKHTEIDITNFFIKKTE